MRVEAVPVIAVLNKLQGRESPLSVRVARRKKETSQTKCVQYATDAVVVGPYARPLRGGGVRVEALAVFQWVLCGLGRFGVNLSCPGGFSGSTWRGFGVNLTCYETLGR